MSGLIGTLSMAARAMNVNQINTQTASHNIANVNTDGYSRQRVNVASETPNKVSGGFSIGNGVKIESITRDVDSFVENQLRQGEGLLSKAKSKHEIMSGIEALFNEPSMSGINNSMSNMFNSWSNLSSRPESSVSKLIAVEKTAAFANQLNKTANGLESAKENLSVQMNKDLQDFNQSVSKLSSLNEKIVSLKRTGYETNDLLDYRDNLLKEINKKYETQISFDYMGRATLSVNKEALAGGKVSIVSAVEERESDMLVSFYEGGDTSKPQTVSVEKNSAIKVNTPIYTNAEGNLKVIENPSYGKLSAQLESMEYLNQKTEELDKFANGMKYAMNTIQGIEILAGTSAKDMKVNQEVSDNPDMLVSGKTGASGDGSRALAVSSLRTSKLDFDNLLNNEYDEATMSFTAKKATPEDFYNKFVTDIGNKTELSEREIEWQENLVSQLQNRRDSVSGVSIDEELVNLLQNQRAYEANARVINAVDSMLNTLINNTGTK